MAAAGTVAVLLPGAFYALKEKKKPPVDLLRKHKRADGGRDRLQPRHLAVAVADAGDEHGLHPVRPDARGSACGHDRQRRARARARQTRSARIAAGKAADLAVWRVESLAELGYWIGLPGPERRIFAGVDSLEPRRPLFALICWAALGIRLSVQTYAG